MLENATMRQTVIRLLKPLHAVSVENGMTHPGTPDVSYAGGWIENKAMEHWPVKPETPLRVDHFTPQQRIWLIRRRRAGGRAFLLLTVGRDWLLFDGAVAAECLGKVPQHTLYTLAAATWIGTPLAKELIECLTADPPSFKIPTHGS